MELSIASWNSTGSAKHKCDWFNEFMSSMDIKLANLQETFRAGKAPNLYFKNKFSKHRNHTTPASRKDPLSAGRPKGGLVQLWDKDIQISIENIPTSNFRVQAQLIRNRNFQALWINTYHPTDKPNNDISELEQVLVEVGDILDNHPNSEVIWAGDLNYNTQRVTTATSRIQEWLDQRELISVNKLIGIDYTYTHTDHVTSSILDHIIVSPNLLDKIVEGGVHHSGTCPSGHDPI